MSGLRVRDLLERKREVLRLALVSGDAGLDRIIAGPEVSSPGLALSGYVDRFAERRIQVMGETEVTYLQSLAPAARGAVLKDFLRFEIPVIFVTKALEPPPELVEASRIRSVPLIRSSLKTGEFYRRIQPFLEEEFAPSTAMHGSLADVYGVGLLFVGPSGIGKSECVLDLVERGHRLVADDVVVVTRRGVDVLIGRGHELQRHHMEIRGIGIIDIRALFGIRAIRQQKRIEVVVQLEEWREGSHYDRLGLEVETVPILEVAIPKVVIPLNPGKNLTVLCEVVAMRHLLRYAGVDSATLFDRRLRDRLVPVREYLEEDYE